MGGLAWTRKAARCITSVAARGGVSTSFSQGRTATWHLRASQTGGRCSRCLPRTRETISEPPAALQTLRRAGRTNRLESAGGSAEFVLEKGNTLCTRPQQFRSSRDPYMVALFAFSKEEFCRFVIGTPSLGPAGARSATMLDAKTLHTVPVLPGVLEITPSCSPENIHNKPLQDIHRHRIPGSCPCESSLGRGVERWYKTPR